MEAKAPTNHPITRTIVKSTIMRQAIVAEVEEVMEVTENAQPEYQLGSTQLATKNTARDKNSNSNSNNLILSMSQLPERHHQGLPHHYHKARNLTKLRISPVKKGAQQM